MSDRDKATRAAALGTLETVYMSEGPAIWSMLGRLTDQQQSLLEERFKYTDKQVQPGGISSLICMCVGMWHFLCRNLSSQFLGQDSC